MSKARATPQDWAVTYRPIARVAVCVEGTIYSMARPGRHCDLIRALVGFKPELAPIKGGAAQGFVTEDGEYLTRTEAAKVALGHGQITALAHGPQLYSEDLW